MSILYPLLLSDNNSFNCIQSRHERSSILSRGISIPCNHPDESLYPYLTAHLLQEKKVASILGMGKIDNENDTDAVFNCLPT